MNAIYGVVSTMPDGRQDAVYEGTDYAQAERLALSAYRRWYGAAYVSVMLDGGAWRDVKHVPGNVGGGGLSTAVVTDAGFCLHPQCGQIHPLSCYCAATMTEEEKARYAESR